jgi:hypothetical protein
MNPRQIAGRLEARRSIEPAGVERFAGYALLGLAFESGHVISVRRATASSVGPPFSSIWLRSPAGEWSVLTNVDPARSCPRYCGTLPITVGTDDIELKWSGPAEIGITARRARLHLAFRLSRTPATALLGTALRLVPSSVQRRRQTPLRLAAAAARLLGLGDIVLSGRTASSLAWRARPRAIWRVSAAAAVLEGRDLGSVVRLPRASPLGVLAGAGNGGLFAAGEIELVTDAIATAVAARQPAGRATPDSARDRLLWRVLTRSDATGQ